MGDSLFGSDSEDDILDVSYEKSACTCSPVSSNIPSIPGLHVFRSLLPAEVQDSLIRAIIDAQAVNIEHPQAMLFPRSSSAKKDVAACPEFLVPFVTQLPGLLEDLLPKENYDIVFDESKALQTIINLYEPGAGITPHVDLPHRYAEPIIGASLLSSTVMDFLPLGTSKPKHHVRLDPGDVYILLREARYDYKHGIAYRDHDILLDGTGRIARNERSTRISITFRRMANELAVLSVDG